MSVGKLLQAVDIGAKPIHLNYDGNKAFTTTLGGACGLAIYTLILVFSLYRCGKLLRLEEPAIYEVTQGLDPLELE